MPFNLQSEHNVVQLYAILTLAFWPRFLNRSFNISLETKHIVINIKEIFKTLEKISKKAASTFHNFTAKVR